MSAQSRTTSVMNRFSLRGCTAFVSGAAGHLGRAMVLALSDAGAHVILNGRNRERLENFKRELDTRGASTEYAVFDMGDIAAVRAFFSAQKRLDVLVNNAISMTPAPFDALDAAAFEETYRSSVIGGFEAVRAARPALKAAVAENGDASVINISSMYGAVAPDARLYSRPGQASPAHYGPAKAAMLQLTRHLAAELGGDNIRVNALVPGPFPKAAVAQADPAFGERLAGKTMLGRTGAPEEIGGPLLFLASSASSFITGTSLPVDGGWTAW